MAAIITQVIETVNTKVIHSGDEMTCMETIGQRLKRLRESRGLSQGALASQAGLKSQGTIGNIERETRGYGDSVVDIARVLGVSPDYLRCNDSGETGAVSTVTTLTPSPAPGVPTVTLAQALEVVGRALLAADAAMRSSAVDLLVTYVRDPASNDDLIPAIAKRLSAPADLQRRADIERALTKNKEGMETRDISPKTFAGGGDEPTFAKKQ